MNSKQKQPHINHTTAQMLAECALQDIRQSNLEESLQESEATFRSLFENMSDPILLLKNGCFIDCNAATLQLLGYKNKFKFLNQSPSDISPTYQPDGRQSDEKATEMINTALKAGFHRFEWVHTRADASNVPVEVTLTPIKIAGELILHTLWRDITERKKADKALLALKDLLQEQNEELQVNEEALREQNDELLATEEMLRIQIGEYEISQKLLQESEERYRAIHDASFGGIIIHDKGLILECNQGLSDMTGFSLEELQGMNGLKLIAPQYIDTVLQYISRGYDQRYEVEGLRKDGSLYPLMIRGKNIIYKGNSARVIELRDITERKQAEEALKTNNAFLNTMLDAIPVPVFYKDIELRYEGINKAFEEYYGTTKEEMLGKTVFDLAPKELADIYHQKDMELLQKQGDQVYESQIKNMKRGELRNVVFHKATFTDQKGSVRGMIGAILDITEHKKLEREELKNEKLESLGVLAGGIAHDFNNILTGIMGNISFAQLFIDANHKCYKPLKEAQKASIRASELAHQLLTFARGGEPIKKNISIKSLVYEALSLVLHGSNVKGVIQIPDSINAIKADEGQMSQVLNNIIINAVQAMPDGGIITITARNENILAQNCFNLNAGVYVKLTCTDQGCGITNENLKKVFDPYFTTKLAGNGLGLASAHSIINRHGGYIGVSSIVDTGTTFVIYLPSTNEIDGQDNLSDEAANNSKHSGCILVMDDETAILEMISEMLEYLGYKVVTCQNGKEAIEQYKNKMATDTPFSAVIMDLTIPAGMGGKEAASHISSLDPAARLIVSSGYSNDPIMSDFGKYGFAGAVAKPYTIQAFKAVLTKVLTESTENKHCT